MFLFACTTYPSTTPGKNSKVIIFLQGDPTFADVRHRRKHAERSNPPADVLLEKKKNQAVYTPRTAKPLYFEMLRLVVSRAGQCPCLPCAPFFFFLFSGADNTFMDTVSSDKSLVRFLESHLFSYAFVELNPSSSYPSVPSKNPIRYSTPPIYFRK